MYREDIIDDLHDTLRSAVPHWNELDVETRKRLESGLVVIAHRLPIAHIKILGSIIETLSNVHNVASEPKTLVSHADAMAFARDVVRATNKGC